MLASSIILLSGCSTGCRIPHIEKPVAPTYAITNLNADASNSAIAKAVVISWRQCNDYNGKLINLIDAVNMEK